MGARRLDGDRTAELLDGAMAVFAARGFAELRMTDLAGELRCSTGTLYKLAANKDSLVLLCLDRWAATTLREMSFAADAQADPLTRARTYWSEMLARVGQLTLKFRGDVERYESTRRQWLRTSDQFIERFSVYLATAMDAGELRRMHPRLLAELLRHISGLLRDAELLADLNMTTSQAFQEIDRFVWHGLEVGQGV